MPIVVTWPEGATPAAYRRQVRAAQEQAWPGNEERSADDLGPVHDPALRPRSMLLVDRGLVLASLDLLFRAIRVEGVVLEAAGLSTVVTPEAQRRRGFGQALVTAGRAEMLRLGVDLGLFTCDRPLAPFYQRCGWEHLPGTILVGGTQDVPFPSDSRGMDKMTFGSFFSSEAERLRDSVAGSRVPLYCGRIDRLW